MSGIEKKINGLDRLKEFFVRNMWAIWIVSLFNSIVLILVTFIVLNMSMTTKLSVEKAIHEMKNGIVMLDLIGRPIVTTPQKLTPTDERYKKSISNYVQLYGIYDWATLTDSFQKTTRTADDAYNHSKKMREFVKNFFPDTKCQAYKDFVSYITKSVFLMNKNNLAERITIASATISNFTSHGGEFNIRIVFHIQANIYDGNSEAYKLKDGQIIVDAIGTLKAEDGNPINPLGIQFTKKFKPNVIKKRI